MILKHLFLQYNNDKGPTYGSRFMKFCGELVLGSPDKKGLGHLRKDLKDTYYYIKEDRQIPMKAIQAWQIQSILLAQYRDLEAPQISRATFLGLLPVIFICVGLAAPFNGAFKSSAESSLSGGAGQPGSLISGLFKGERITLEKCMLLSDELRTGKITKADIPNLPVIAEECETLMNQVRKGDYNQ